MVKNARSARAAVTQTTLLAQTQLPMSPSPLLADLHPESRAALLAIGRARMIDTGAMLFRQGDAHEGIFLIQDGVVRSYYESEDGRELTLGFWGEGNFVGAPQLFGGGQHAWTSQAQMPARCLYLPGRELRALAEQRSDLAMALLEALIHKSGCYAALLQLMATHSMKVRLARLLAMLADTNDEPLITLTHNQLSGMIGSTRQWVSQALDLFERERLIDRPASGAIRVLRADDLASLK